VEVNAGAVRVEILAGFWGNGNETWGQVDDLSLRLSR